ncbi:MAG: hypothetical protein PHE05_04975, partial [Bacilli bacterium]|nr:hypothetical protein [Bacilli bacterium]
VITKEDLFPYMKDEFITKRIIIEYLIQKGIVKNNDEASLKYTGRQAKSYEKRAEFTSEEAIDLIKKSGGIPVLAHPTTLHMTNGELDDEISRLKDLGLVGMEVNNTSKTSISQLNIYRMLADKYELVKTSGTDFHRVDRNPFCIGVNNSDSDSFFNLPEIKEVIEKGRR